jgi:hypothetical protein
MTDDPRWHSGQLDRVLLDEFTTDKPGLFRLFWRWSPSSRRPPFERPPRPGHGPRPRTDRPPPA